MNEANMISVLMWRAMEDKQHQLVLPNSVSAIGWWSWESDLISATKAWMVHEYEVKLTAADYAADFRKESKHWALKARHSTRAPNYFWYALPLQLIDEESLAIVSPRRRYPVPDYVGIIGVYWHQHMKGWCTKTVREAPRLHTRKLDRAGRDRCLRLASYRIKKLYRRFYQPEAPREDR
jgi:hypothetical protein